ncbi:MAG: hypothetical protein ACJ8H8_22450 [Geminicoccaceae bacterium]
MPVDRAVGCSQLPIGLVDLVVGAAQQPSLPSLGQFGGVLQGRCRGGGRLGERGPQRLRGSLAAAPWSWSPRRV